MNTFVIAGVRIQDMTWIMMASGTYLIARLNSFRTLYHLFQHLLYYYEAYL